MSDYLTGIIARSFELVEVIRPRLPGLFEPLSGDRGSSRDRAFDLPLIPEGSAAAGASTTADVAAQAAPHALNASARHASPLVAGDGRLTPQTHLRAAPAQPTADPRPARLNAPGAFEPSGAPFASTPPLAATAPPQRERVAPPAPFAPVQAAPSLASRKAAAPPSARPHPGPSGTLAGATARGPAPPRAGRDVPASAEGPAAASLPTSPVPLEPADVTLPRDPGRSGREPHSAGISAREPHAPPRRETPLPPAATPAASSAGPPTSPVRATPHLNENSRLPERPWHEALPGARRRATGQTDETVVRVNIGRVEVRAVMPPAPPVPAAVPRRPDMSLDEYLKRRSRSPS
jgi:hypothetical protein